VEHKFTNRLNNETSPYLLQHAHNPVDWYPWGAEALEKSKKENKPIFLSIGYATCHWCHVMEHESFENEEIAKLLNEYFVPIKVDREERPDLDAVYMKATIALTGGGGWHPRMDRAHGSRAGMGSQGKETGTGRCACHVSVLRSTGCFSAAPE
jgi:uncharacterized protein YyaL (SSP411 family)